MDAGLYLDISLAEYLADPTPDSSLSASIAHVLLTESPRHAWLKHPRLNPHYEPEQAAKFDLGTAAHAVLLEGADERIQIIHAENYKTKAAQEQRDAARKAGKIPLLPDQWQTVEAMMEAAYHALKDSELSDVLHLSNGQPEVTLLWQGPGCWLRARPDWVSADRKLIVDYKSTAGSAEPNAWTRAGMLAHGFDLQAALGVRGIRQLTKQTAQFVFIVQETDPPYAVSLVGLSPDFMEFANRKLNHAIVTWSRCLQANDWPGYASRVAWMDVPKWADTQFTERVWAEADGKENVK